jgi:hypothetical protein
VVAYCKINGLGNKVNFYTKELKSLEIQIKLINNKKGTMKKETNKKGTMKNKKNNYN